MHETRFLLWNIEAQGITKSILIMNLGRQLMQAIDCDNKQMLQAACELHEGDICRCQKADAEDVIWMTSMALHRSTASSAIKRSNIAEKRVCSSNIPY